MPRLNWLLLGGAYSFRFKPTRLLIGMDAGTVVPVSRLVLGFESDTLGKATLAEKGTFPAVLYTSFPWTRSYIMPYPPRSTVLPEPVRS